MNSLPQLEHILDRDSYSEINLGRWSSITRRSHPTEVRLRWLPPAMMWAELEDCRKIADLVEEPFALLLCTSRTSISLKSLQSSSFAGLNRFADVLGPMGLFDRKRVGLVVQNGFQNHICDVADSIRDSLGIDFLEFKVLSYPFTLDNNLLLPNRAGPVSPLTCNSLQPLFALPTPWGKRAFDVVIAAIGMLILLPLFLIVAVLIRCSSRGPVLFKQRRIGLGGVPFKIYKFRTMVVDAEQQKCILRHLNEQDGPAFKMKADPRTTRLGRLLRFTCIDELPQLWNVLRGDMSLVGPRPLPCDESNACRWWHRRRLDVLPGVTCTWQARGRTVVSFDEWMRLDLEYVRRRSFGIDLHVLIATFAFLVARCACKDRKNQAPRLEADNACYTTKN